MSRRDDLYRWQYFELAKRCVEKLKKNRFGARCFQSVSEGRDFVLTECEKTSTIGFGGSMSVASMNIYDELAGRGKILLNHGLPELSPKERGEIRLKQQSCDLFLTSTNAVTLDGKLVNMDGTGNRVNAMAFGPKKTLVITGGNKIVKDADSAMKRIKDHVAPMNARRLSLDTPCAVSGICADCDSPQRICNIITILEKEPYASNIEVVLMAEPLGL